MANELQGISRHIIQIDPHRLKLLDVNARYMRHEVFSRLVENVKADGGLTSVPFAWQIHDDTTQIPLADENGEPVYEVLSGNHRVKAALAATLDLIDVMVTEQYLTPARRRAIQLSHNALAGEDDLTTLKAIYDTIDDVDWRTYSGLDDKQLQLFQSVSVEAMSEANLNFQTISLVFLPTEVEQVAQIWDTVKKELTGSQEAWLARFADYDKAMNALEAAGAAYGIRNTATTLLAVLDIFARHITDLREAWLDDEGDPVQAGRWVPLESILGTLFIPAAVGAKLNRAIERRVSAGDLDSGKRWQIFETLLDD
jgi:hypothetical protein